MWQFVSSARDSRKNVRQDKESGIIPSFDHGIAKAISINLAPKEKKRERETMMTHFPFPFSFLSFSFFNDVDPPPNLTRSQHLPVLHR